MEEPEKLLQVRSNLLLPIASSLLKIFAILISIIVALLILDHGFGIDLVQIIRDAVQGFWKDLDTIRSTASDLDITTDTFFTKSLFTELAYVPLCLLLLYYGMHILGVYFRSWELYDDRIVIRSFFRRKEHGYADVYDIFGERYVPFLKFGKIIMKLKGEEKNIKLEYIIDAQGKAEEIKTIIGQTKISQTKASQPPPLLQQARQQPVQPPPQKTQQQVQGK